MSKLGENKTKTMRVINVSQKDKDIFMRMCKKEDIYAVDLFHEITNNLPEVVKLIKENKGV